MKLTKTVWEVRCGYHDPEEVVFDTVHKAKAFIFTRFAESQGKFVPEDRRIYQLFRVETHEEALRSFDASHLDTL